MVNGLLLFFMLAITLSLGAVLYQGWISGRKQGVIIALLTWAILTGIFCYYFHEAVASR